MEFEVMEFEVMEFEGGFLRGLGFRVFIFKF